MMNIAMFITAQMAALYLCWRLAIVGIPAGVAGGIAEQALSSVRTVYSYVREETTAQSYSAALKPTLKLGFKQGLLKGMAIGSVGIGYGVWALQGWYGSILVTEKNLKGGNIFTAGVCIIYGGFALGSCLINVKHFMDANVAAAQIFEMIERVPNIDSDTFTRIIIYCPSSLLIIVVV